MQQWVAKAPDVARENCPDTNPANDAGCAGYHGVRPYLYCAGLRTSFDTYSRMFFAPLRQWAGATSAPRVLVSGAADFVVPAIVTRALRELGRDPHVTIVDRCRTPLLMCEDAGLRLKMAWKTAQADVREQGPSAPYDLVVSDRLLSFFESSQRPSVIDAWKNQLREGGRIITAISVYPDARPVARDREILHNETLHRYQTQLDRLSPQVTIEQLSRMVRTYNDFRHRHFISSAEEVLSLFEQSGFEVRAVQRIKRRTDARLPSGAGRYIVWLVADKPG